MPHVIFAIFLQLFPWLDWVSQPKENKGNQSFVLDVDSFPLPV